MQLSPRLDALGLDYARAGGDTEPSLVSAQADYVRQTLPVALWGSTGLMLVFGLQYWMDGLHSEVLVWSGLGGAAFLLRLLLGQWYRPGILREAGDAAPARFLWGCVLASLLAGVTFGWGWWTIYPHLTHDEQLAYFAGNVALLFGGLYSYSVFLPIFVVFCVSSLSVSLAIQIHLSNQAQTEWLAATVGTGLVMVVSMMFALRSAISFKVNHLLQQRELRLLQELTSKRDEAVAATLAKSRFLASVSHDLRQPMHAINLYLSSLASSYHRQQADPANQLAGETIRDCIHSLQESTLYLNSMFESLLDISRLDAGTVSASMQHTTLVRMVSQLEADYGRLAEAESMAFEMRLPAQFHLMEIHTDPALLERLLRNLIVNAFRYTRKGGVRVSVVAMGKFVEFRVVDTGPGIARALRQRVFEEFYQVPGSQGAVSRSANTGRGIGLGLSISARLAEKLGTRIRLHSWAGKGSVFAVRLPMRIALRPTSHELSPASTGSPTRLAPGTFIAVIDDDAEILRSTRIMLESFGARAFTALSGVEAARRLGETGQCPHFIISDYQLGSEDGLAAIERLREEFNEDIPALLITGDTSPEHVALFRSSGLKVLHKPVTGETLLDAIQAELRR